MTEKKGLVYLLELSFLFRLCLIRYVRMLPDLEIPQALQEWIRTVEFQDA